MLLSDVLETLLDEDNTATTGCTLIFCSVAENIQRLPRIVSIPSRCLPSRVAIQPRIVYGSHLCSSFPPLLSPDEGKIRPRPTALECRRWGPVGCRVLTFLQLRIYGGKWRYMAGG